MHLEVVEFGFNLSGLQKEYLEKKITTLTRLLGRINPIDEETLECKINLTRDETKSDLDRYLVRAVLYLPGRRTLEAEVREISPEVGIDRIKDKLEEQIRKLKTRLQEQGRWKKAGSEVIEETE
ncbi:hypothetical protein COT40_02280 [Candidatus Peregrinibacteria bacterium CG08_land_8_20_14_0_20_41_10]|nr:MAG: hypothetical protein AUJ78_01340 [Candidatus Peregrinibacteria bacterium CG1_02_41_10]PIS32025.1 MAG: hypothetical protein COT40_02280 [Candidatus Peregrinibacteria bacterium CG08_land_8_20_14_0_20_41_10]